MNKEVIKAMNRKETKVSKFRKWQRKNGYKVYKVIFFPIWITSILKEKITKLLDSRQAWNEKKANEILSYYIPRRSDWDAAKQGFWFFDNGSGWSDSYAKKYLKRKDRRFWRIYTTYCGGEIRKYLIEEFELDGFTKEIIGCTADFTEIIFRKE